MKLRTKILAFTIGLILLLGVSVVIFVKTTLTRTLLAEFREEGIFQAQQLANAVINDLLTGNKLRLQLLINDYKKQGRHAKYIFLLDGNREPVVHTFSKGFPAALRDVNSPGINKGFSIGNLDTEEGAIIDIAVPVLNGQAGVLHIGLSEEPLVGKVNKIIGIILGIIFIVLAAGCVIAVVFASLMTKPVIRLIGISREAAQGNLEGHSFIQSGDEIGELAVAFSKMLNELKVTTVSRDYFHKLINSMNDSVIVIDIDLKIKEVNDATLDLLGASRDELLKIGLNGICGNGKNCCVNTSLLSGEGHLSNIETYYKTWAGESIPMVLSASRIKGEAGHRDKIIIVAKDNRKYKQTEKDLKQKQEELEEQHNKLNILFKKVEIAKEEWEKTMDCVGDMVILCNSEGRIKRINLAVRKFAQKSYQEILGMKWEDLLQDFGLETTGICAGGVELFHNASQKWFKFASYPFEDSGLQLCGKVITIHETTELKQVSKELVEANESIESDRQMLQNALDHILVLIQNVITSTDFSIRLSNPNLQKCYEKKKCTKSQCVCYGQEALRCWQVAGTYCGGKVQGEFAQKYGNCAECVVFKEATNDPIYQIGEQFNNMMHVLEVKNQALHDANAELKTAQAQMVQKEKMASIGQLAAGVAHEINNPMGFISSNLGSLGKYMNKLTEFIAFQGEVMESLESAEPSEKVKELRKKLKIDYVLEDIEQLIKESLDGAERVKKIVQNLKSFSRVDEAEYQPADINECIESTLNIVWNELKYKAEVVKEYGKLPLTKCYPQQLNQVFMNLLVNAAQAIEKQGEIRIKTWDGDGAIHVSVSDTGGGIPQDKLGRIFEPFFTTKPVGKGTGLGLSITYDIIKKHKGEISVESEIGKGTTFNVTIPVLEEKENA